MPFISQSQRRYFHAAASRGEISPQTVHEWEAETPKGKKLPEHVKKTGAALFWSAVSEKQAAGPTMAGPLEAVPSRASVAGGAIMDTMRANPLRSAATGLVAPVAGAISGSSAPTQFGSRVQQMLAAPAGQPIPLRGGGTATRHQLVGGDSYFARPEARESPAVVMTGGYRTPSGAPTSPMQADFHARGSAPTPQVAAVPRPAAPAPVAPRPTPAPAPRPAPAVQPAQVAARPAPPPAAQPLVAPPPNLSTFLQTRTQPAAPAAMPAGYLKDWYNRSGIANAGGSTSLSPAMRRAVRG